VPKEPLKLVHPEGGREEDSLERYHNMRDNVKRGPEPIVSHPVFRSKLNAFLYVCQDQVSHIK
jgi:hypothetical protein